MERISFSEMTSIMRKATKEGQEMKAVIVYKQDNWDEEYSLEARSYVVSNASKYFDEGMISNSIIGSALDGSDPCVFLHRYNWEVAYCYILNED